MIVVDGTTVTPIVDTTTAAPGTVTVSDVPIVDTTTAAPSTDGTTPVPGGAVTIIINMYLMVLSLYVILK